MKIFLLSVLLFSALSDILCQNVSPDEDNWMSDMYPDEVSDFRFTMLFSIDIQCNLIHNINI